MTSGRMFRGFETWYGIAGDGEEPGRLPLLCLHGGPGSSHDPLEPLAELAQQGRRVVFYDQLGGGDSDRPDDRSLWTVETFLDQLRTVREALGLARAGRGLCTGAAVPCGFLWTRHTKFSLFAGRVRRGLWIAAPRTARTR